MNVKVKVIDKDYHKANQIRLSRKKLFNKGYDTDCLLATAIKRIYNPAELYVGTYRATIDGVRYNIPENVTTVIEAWCVEDEKTKKEDSVLPLLPLEVILEREPELRFE